MVLTGRGYKETRPSGQQAGRRFSPDPFFAYRPNSIGGQPTDGWIHQTAAPRFTSRALNPALATSQASSVFHGEEEVPYAV
jgi:hypothetical protein